jgi:hypothetical protein
MDNIKKHLHLPHKWNNEVEPHKTCFPTFETNNNRPPTCPSGPQHQHGFIYLLFLQCELGQLSSRKDCLEVVIKGLF